MKTVVDPVFLDLMQSAILWIAANKKRESAFVRDADVTDEQWQAIVDAVFDEQETQ